MKHTEAVRSGQSPLQAVQELAWYSRVHPRGSRLRVDRMVPVRLALLDQIRSWSGQDYVDCTGKHPLVLPLPVRKRACHLLPQYWRFPGYEGSMGDSVYRAMASSLPHARD